MKKKIFLHCLGLSVLTSLYFCVRRVTGAGESMDARLFDYAIYVAVIILPVLVIIGLFEVWVHKENVERHLGEKGKGGILLALVLGALTVGPMIIALPTARSLYRKGASLTVVLVYLGASSVLRIPMTFFEASFMGPLFSVLRITTATVLIVVTSLIIGAYYRGGRPDLPEIE